MSAAVTAGMHTWTGNERQFRGVGVMAGFFVRKDDLGVWHLHDERAGRKPFIAGPFSTATRAREVASERVAR